MEVRWYDDNDDDDGDDAEAREDIRDIEAWHRWCSNTHVETYRKPQEEQP